MLLLIVVSLSSTTYHCTTAPYPLVYLKHVKVSLTKTANIKVQKHHYSNESLPSRDSPTRETRVAECRVGRTARQYGFCFYGE